MISGANLKFFVRNKLSIFHDFLLQLYGHYTDLSKSTVNGADVFQSLLEYEKAIRSSFRLYE